MVAGGVGIVAGMWGVGCNRQPGERDRVAAARHQLGLTAQLQSAGVKAEINKLGRTWGRDWWLVHNLWQRMEWLLFTHPCTPQWVQVGDDCQWFIEARRR